VNDNAIDMDAVAAIAADFENRPELLVQILVRIVQRHGWISAEVIRQLADILNLSRAEVHGVVEYYHDLRTTPPGRHIVKVCAAEACQAVGSRRLAAHAHATAGRNVTLEPVYCLGNCACAPAVMLDGRTYGRVDEQRLDELLASVQEPDA
jgi:formate dehydrogenase subunit gamma